MLKSAFKLISGIAAGSIAVSAAAWAAGCMVDTLDKPETLTAAHSSEQSEETASDNTKATAEQKVSSETDSTQTSQEVQNNGQKQSQRAAEEAALAYEDSNSTPAAEAAGQDFSQESDVQYEPQPDGSIVEVWQSSDTETTYTQSQTEQEAVTAAASEPYAAAESYTVSPASGDEAYIHSIHTDFITPELTGIYSQAFLQDIREGRNRLDYQGDAQNAEFSLSEIVSFYCSMDQNLPYYETQDSAGSYLELDPDVFSRLQAAVASADLGWAGYTDYVAQADESLNLYTDDHDLVDQINQYICDHFDYEITNSGMPKFLETGYGQCWHYAKLFSDMCNAAGIQAWKVENQDHAWDQVVVDGVTYTFDPTFNDTGPSQTLYSWQ